MEAPKIITHISASSYGTFHRCGEQYRLRYIEHKILPPGVALLRGSSMHEGAKYVNNTKMDTGKEPPIDEVQDCTRDYFVESVTSIPPLLTEEEKADKTRVLNDAMNTAIDMASAYTRQASPKNKNIEIVEERLSADIGLALPILGYTDLVADKKIIDIKTSSKAWIRGQEDTEIQPVFYKMLCSGNGIDTNSAEFIILTKYKNTPKNQVYYDSDTKVNVDIRGTTRNNKDVEIIKRRISIMIEMIDAGNFLPAQESSWVCSEKWCGYYRLCAYSK